MVILLYVRGSWVQRENEVKICIGMRLNALSNIFKLFNYPSPSEGRQIKNHSHRNLTNLITWTTALFNSMKLWVVPCRATQDGRVIVESSDKTWSTGEGNGKPFQYSCLENPKNSIKRQKDRTYWPNMPNMLWEISGEITPERMKRWSQSQSNSQLWMWLVMEVSLML